MKRTMLVLLCGAAMVSHGALIGEYKFDEGSGVTASNSASTGAAYDGVVNGTTAWIPGHDGTGYALDFAGTNGNYVSIPSGFLASVSNQVSIAFWAYGNTNQPQAQIVFQGRVDGGSSRELQSHLPYANQNIYWDAADRQSFGAAGLTDLWKTNWTFWVMTKNADTGEMKVYANGQLKGSTTGKHNMINGAGISAFAIGGQTLGDLNYYGAIDDFKIYDHELTLSEIAIGFDPNIIAPVISKSAGVGESPLEVVFDASETVAGNGVGQYLWSFDTNLTVDATGVTVTNTFVSEGSHPITLWVVDGIGTTNSATTSVLVDSPYFSTNLVGTMEYVRENMVSSNYPSASSNDLFQTAYLSNTLYSSYADLTNNWANLLDGSVGTSDQDTNGAEISATGFTRMFSGDWFEVTFDLSGAPLGYDLNRIKTIAGWSIEAGGRSNQGYDVIVTYVDGSTETIASWKYWNPNVPATYWTGVTLDRVGGGSFVSGVKKVRIQQTQGAVPGGWVLWREFDFIGSPSPTSDVTVTSQYGSPDPAVGTHTYYRGDTVELSVDESFWENGSNYVCTGWTGTGSVPTSAASNSTGAIELTAPESSIVWNWALESVDFWLDFETVGSGTVSMVDGWYDEGSTQAVVATPAYGWSFTGWDGDVIGGSTNLDVVVVSNMTVTATFSDDPDGDGLTNTQEVGLGTDPLDADSDNDGLSDGFEVTTNGVDNLYLTDPLDYDSDNDGTSDGHEIQLGFNPNDPNDDPDKDEDQILDSWERDNFGNIILCDPGDDPDGDLYTNLEEFNNGTDPNVMDTFVEMYPAFEITWKAVAGTNYQVQVNTNLPGGTWSDIGETVTGTGSRTGVLVRTRNADSKMFRIEIQP